MNIYAAITAAGRTKTNKGAVEMFETHQSEDFGNRTYQAELAQSLLANMDPEDAIDFCVSNEWGGVLEHMLAPRSVD